MARFDWRSIDKLILVGKCIVLLIEFNTTFSLCNQQYPSRLSKERAAIANLYYVLLQGDLCTPFFSCDCHCFY